MYYCSRSKDKEYSLEKIKERMKVLSEKIPEVAKLPPTGEEEIINGLNLGHPVTELIVEYSALKFWAENPPDPRGDPMCSRVPPYFIHVSTKELALAIGLEYRTALRAKELAHKKLELQDRADITVNEFCKAWNYDQDDIDKIHQNLAYIREGKWNKIKEIHKNNKKTRDDK